jgi:hypothetical protein
MKVTKKQSLDYLKDMARKLDSMLKQNKYFSLIMKNHS